MRPRPAPIVVGVLVVLAGCGAAPPGDPGPAPTPTPTPAPAAPHGTLEVHFINVGQSVATLVVGPTGETMLIDSGHFNDDGEYVLGYLRRHDVDRIDYLVTSHGDADHIGGHAAVIEYYETEADGIGAVYDPGIAASTRTYEAYLDAVERHGVPLYETRAGDAIPMEGVAAAVLAPPADRYLAGRERNENSIVLRVAFGRTSFLFTGDAEEREEEYLVETYGSGLRATVLKAGHHGSKTSTGGTLLDAAAPKAVVISSAYDSQFGHPHEEVLGRLADRSIPAYWTATHGNVVLESDGRTVEVGTQRAAPTDPSRLREGEPIEPGADDPVRRRATIEGGGSATTVAPPATDGGTPTAAGGLSVVEVHADAAGDDRENLNDEYVRFENTGDRTLELGGWTVEDAAGNTYTFPAGFELAPGERVTLHTGSGEDTATDRYWGAGSPVWNNGGDTVIVRNETGEEVLRESYP